MLLEEGIGGGEVVDALKGDVEGAEAEVALAAAGAEEAAGVIDGVGEELLSGGAIFPDGIEEELRRRVGRGSGPEDAEGEAESVDLVGGGVEEGLVGCAGGGEADFGVVESGELRGDAAGLPFEEGGLPAQRAVVPAPGGGAGEAEDLA